MTRHPLPRRRRAAAAAAALSGLAVLTAGVLLLAACGTDVGGARRSRGDDGLPQVAPSHPVAGTGAARTGRNAPAVEPGRLPGVGPHTLAAIPVDSTQLVLVTGAGPDAATATVQLYLRTSRAADGSWRPDGPVWPAHNAARGWTAAHHTGDLRSPVGVFGLTDEGGRLPDPGTLLTYDHAPIGFTARGRGVDGESLRGAFDYVIAVNYNRKPGMSPRDWTRPLGPSRGGGIWLHVDHGGPTEGCISLPLPAVRTLLRTLDPTAHPVVLMGDAASLSR